MGWRCNEERESLVGDVLEGMVEGKRGRGRPRTKMIDHLKRKEDYKSLKIREQDREEWRKIP